MRTGLRLLEDHEKAMNAVRRKVAIGLTAADEGRVIDGEVFFEQLESEEVAWGKRRRRKSA